MKSSIGLLALIVASSYTHINSSNDKKEPQTEENKQRTIEEEVEDPCKPTSWEEGEEAEETEKQKIGEKISLYITIGVTTLILTGIIFLVTALLMKI